MWNKNGRAVGLSENAAFTSGLAVRPALEKLLPAPAESIELLSRRGFLSLRVFAGGQHFKVAECRSSEQALLAEAALMQARHAGGPVPEFVGREQAVIATDWVEGSNVAHEPCSRQKEILLDCQVALHGTPLDDGWEAGARYVHLEALSDRFRRMAPPVFNEKEIQKALAKLWKGVPAASAVSVLHPDLIPANVVLADHGPVVIDNEAITIGYGREFDIWHTAESLCGHRNDRGMARYVNEYHDRFPCPSALERKPVWDGFRRLRRVMKALEKGRRIKARWLARPLLVG